MKPTRTQRASFEFCTTVARDHYENFPVASKMLPRRLRPHVAALYAFARQADDFADEPIYDGRRQELLADWRDRLESAAAGQADHPVFIALSETIATHHLPVSLLHDLISAFEQDVTVRSYQTFDELLGYCRLSANPVGRLVLHLFDRRDETLMPLSDAICTGLQLANFWQDVSADLDKGRCYIPMEDMERFGCSQGSLAGRRVTEPFVALMRFELQRARDQLAGGASLPAAVGGRLGYELRLTLLGGHAILDRIEKRGCDVFRKRPQLGKLDWARILVRAALRPGRLAPAARSAERGPAEKKEKARRAQGEAGSDGP